MFECQKVALHELYPTVLVTRSSLLSHAHPNFFRRNLIHRKTKLAAIPRDRFAWLRSQYIACPVIYLRHLFHECTPSQSRDIPYLLKALGGLDSLIIILDTGAILGSTIHCNFPINYYPARTRKGVKQSVLSRKSPDRHI